MEIEDELNAGHCVDPESDIQLWADASGTVDAINVSIMPDFVVRCLFLLAPFPPTANCEVGIDPQLEFGFPEICLNPSQSNTEL